MDILISFDKKDMAVALEGGGQLALYTVPKSYSGDGLFLATWGAGELEPIPACSSDKATPLLRLAVVEDNDGLTLREHFKAEGVTYA